MLRRFFMLVVLATLANAPVPASETVTSEQLTASLQHAVGRGVPGLSAAIANRDGVVWTGAAGWADVRARTPIDQHTLFGIGSITKVFVATVVLQLVEEGRLKLTDTPHGILGAVPATGIANAGTATVADLLGHRSGVPSWEDDPRWIRKGRGSGLDPSHRWRKTEALAYIRGTPATNPPGGAFAYSNSNYTLLGLMIETVTRRRAEAEIRRRILQPLALTDTYLEGFEPGRPRQVAHRYHYATTTFRKTAGIAPSFIEIEPDLVDTGANNLLDEWTAGGMITSPHDLVTFARALRDGRLLKPASLAFMEQWTPDGEGGEVGHGLFRMGTPQQPLIGHTGGVLGFTAVLWWSEQGDALVAVLSNGSGMHAGKSRPNAASVGLSPAFAELAIHYASTLR